MATIKSYTDLAQSKKLTKILPIESADMYYCYGMDIHTKVWSFDDTPTIIDNSNQIDIDFDIPCWSLAALLGVLPTLDDRNAILCKDIRYDKWHVNYHSTATLSIIDTERYDNPVDACVDMILKLNELKML